MKTGLLSFIIAGSLLLNGFMPAFAQSSNTLTSAQKIEMVRQLRDQVAAKRGEIAGANAKYLNGQLYYQIGDIGSTITGWTTAIVLLFGQTLDIKKTQGKLFWGALAGYAATKVMEVHFKEVMNISKAEKDRIENELSNLEQRLSGLEAGLVALGKID